MRRFSVSLVALSLFFAGFDAFGAVTPKLGAPKIGTQSLKLGAGNKLDTSNKTKTGSNSGKTTTTTVDNQSAKIGVTNKFDISKLGTAGGGLAKAGDAMQNKGDAGMNMDQMAGMSRGNASSAYSGSGKFGDLSQIPDKHADDVGVVNAQYENNNSKTTSGGDTSYSGSSVSSYSIEYYKPDANDQPDKDQWTGTGTMVSSKENGVYTQDHETREPIYAEDGKTIIGEHVIETHKENKGDGSGWSRERKEHDEYYEQDEDGNYHGAHANNPGNSGGSSSDSGDNKTNDTNSSGTSSDDDNDDKDKNKDKEDKKGDTSTTTTTAGSGGTDEFGPDGDSDFSGKGDFGKYGSRDDGGSGKSGINNGGIGSVGGGNPDDNNGNYGSKGDDGKDSSGVKSGGSGTVGGGWDGKDPNYGATGGNLRLQDFIAPVVNPGNNANKARSAVARSVKMPKITNMKPTLNIGNGKTKTTDTSNKTKTDSNTGKTTTTNVGNQLLKIGTANKFDISKLGTAGGGLAKAGDAMQDKGSTGMNMEQQAGLSSGGAGTVGLGNRTGEHCEHTQNDNGSYSGTVCHDSKSGTWHGYSNDGTNTYSYTEVASNGGSAYFNMENRGDRCAEGRDGMIKCTERATTEDGQTGTIIHDYDSNGDYVGSSFISDGNSNNSNTNGGNKNTSSGTGNSPSPSNPQGGSPSTPGANDGGVSSNNNTSNDDDDDKNKDKEENNTTTTSGGDSGNSSMGGGESDDMFKQGGGYGGYGGDGTGGKDSNGVQSGGIGTVGGGNSDGNNGNYGGGDGGKDSSGVQSGGLGTVAGGGSGKESNYGATGGKLALEGFIAPVINTGNNATKARSVLPRNVRHQGGGTAVKTVTMNVVEEAADEPNASVKNMNSNATVVRRASGPNVRSVKTTATTRRAAGK